MSHNFLEEKVEQVFKNFFDSDITARFTLDRQKIEVSENDESIEYYRIHEIGNHFHIYNKRTGIHIYILSNDVDMDTICHIAYNRSQTGHSPEKRKNMVWRAIYRNQKLKRGQEGLVGIGLVVKSEDDIMHIGVIDEEGENKSFTEREKMFLS